MINTVFAPDAFDTAHAALQSAQDVATAAAKRLADAQTTLATLDAQIGEADPDASGFAALVRKRAEAAAAVSAFQTRSDRAAAALPPLAQAFQQAAVGRNESQAKEFADRLLGKHHVLLDGIEAALMDVVPRRSEIDALIAEGAVLQRGYADLHGGSPSTELRDAIRVASSTSNGDLATALRHLAGAISLSRAEARRNP